MHLLRRPRQCLSAARGRRSSPRAPFSLGDDADVLPVQQSRVRTESAALSQAPASSCPYHTLIPNRSFSAPRSPLAACSSSLLLGNCFVSCCSDPQVYQPLVFARPSSDRWPEQPRRLAGDDHRTASMDPVNDRGFGSAAEFVSLTRRPSARNEARKLNIVRRSPRPDRAFHEVSCASLDLNPEDHVFSRSRSLSSQRRRCSDLGSRRGTRLAGGQNRF